jgi:hypothetical protein
MPSITCGGYSYWTDCGTEYDCHYENAGNLTCEHCACNDGEWDPRTGKKYVSPARWFGVLLLVFVVVSLIVNI